MAFSIRLTHTTNSMISHAGCIVLKGMIESRTGKQKASTTTDNMITVLLPESRERSSKDGVSDKSLVVYEKVKRFKKSALSSRR